MCGRFVSTTSSRDLAAQFCAVVADDGAFEPNHNVAPGTDIRVVVETSEERILTPMHWGLVPFWAKDPSIGNRMINARSETLAERNSFKAAFRRRRCLIPVDGFYEWAEVPGQRRKQPHHIHDPRGVPYAFAGLWERWRGPNRDDDIELRSTTIVTAAANEALAPIHHRMPVILEPETWDLWLDPEVDDIDVLAELLRPRDDVPMEIHPVGFEVGDVRNRGPRLIEPVRPGSEPAESDPGPPGDTLF